MKHPRLSLCMLTLAIAGLLFACESSSSSGSSACKDLQNSLLDCGLLSSGEFQCIEDDCRTQCASDLACGDLTLIFCGDSDSAPDYTSCYESCSTFTCKNGAAISATSECDGYEDCEDGSDESGCTIEEATEFLCDQTPPSGNGGLTSGNSCSAAKQKLKACGLLSASDTFEDCTEPSTPREQCFNACAMGGSCVDLYSLVCDPEEPPDPEFVACFGECDSLSDAEASDFQCASGDESVAREWVCDGYDDCEDGSDEASCASLVCI